MDKLQWLKNRQKGIGGSDVGAILGVNRWKTAFQVYLEKTEELTEIKEEAEAAYWGTSLEELVAKEFTKRTGKKVRRDNRHLVHKEYPFMTANIDRRVVGENSILECKTTSSYGAKDWEGEEIPPSYLLQCQHYLAVTGAEKCYIAVLIGGQKLLIKEIDRDEELIAMIIEAEKQFWIEHVEKRIPPPLDGSTAADKYLKEKYPNSNRALEIDLKAEYKDKISQYISLKDNIKLLEDEAKTLENNIKQELGEAERGAIANFIVTWRAVFSNRVDSKSLKDKYPDIYKEVCRETISRRFEIKEA
jgi:putative phage-type endonuclease